MPGTDTDNAMSTKDEKLREIEEPIPVTVTLENGVTYKGRAIEALPSGLVRVQTSHMFLEVPRSYIQLLQVQQDKVI